MQTLGKKVEKDLDVSWEKNKNHIYQFAFILTKYIYSLYLFISNPWYCSLLKYLFFFFN